MTDDARPAGMKSANCSVGVTASQIEVVREPYRERPIAQLHAVLSMLCHYIWHKELRPGEHMWSIPVDKERDFDCILSDAIDELEDRRKVAAEATALPPAPQPALYSGECGIPREGLSSDTPAMRLAWQFLARRVGDGRACQTCGSLEGDDHEPTDECGIVANLLHETRLLQSELTKEARASLQPHHAQPPARADGE